MYIDDLGHRFLVHDPVCTQAEEANILRRVLNLWIFSEALQNRVPPSADSVVLPMQLALQNGGRGITYVSGKSL